MFALIREIAIFDVWFTESAAAIKNNNIDWVTAREMVSDFAELGFEYNGDPIAALDQDKRHDFLMRLVGVLDFFAKGKLLRQQPKAVYLPNLRARMNDEGSYQLSNFGEKLLQGNMARRRSYIFGMLFRNLSVVLLKRYKWVIGIVSAVTFALRTAEIIESTIVAVVVAIFAIIVTAIIRGVYNAID